jgi:hypothetical protein
VTTPQQFAAGVLALSQREALAGRVALCRSGQALQLVPYGDPGYQQLEDF